MCTKLTFSFHTIDAIYNNILGVLSSFQHQSQPQIKWKLQLKKSKLLQIEQEPKSQVVQLIKKYRLTVAVFVVSILH